MRKEMDFFIIDFLSKILIETVSQKNKQLQKICEKLRPIIRELDILNRHRSRRLVCTFDICIFLSNFKIY